MAYTEKTPAGRWRGIAKQGRVKLGTKTFDKKKDALDWALRQETAAHGGVDPKAGKRRLGICLEEWIAERDGVVAPLTLINDQQSAKHVPHSLKQRTISSITPNDIEGWYRSMRKQGYSDGTIRRHRGAISSFFGWAVRDGRISANPISSARLPEVLEAPIEMEPFTESELLNTVEAIRQDHPFHADVVLILAWTGLRWGEARALRVGDVKWTDIPHLLVSRSHSQSSIEKVTKGRSKRRVPLADSVIPAIQRMAEGKKPSDYLLTGAKDGQLWVQTFTKGMDWKVTGSGRRIHDLRHTAACIWLAKGVDLSTVQEWMGHKSIVTTNRYLHHLGRSADRAGLQRLNSRGGPRGDRELPSELPFAPVITGQARVEPISPIMA